MLSPPGLPSQWRLDGTADVWKGFNVAKECEPVRCSGSPGPTGASIDLMIAVPKHIRWVEAEPSQFETTILNMVINARDARPRGGQIKTTMSLAHGVPPVMGHAAASGALSQLRPSIAGAAWRRTP